MERSIEDEFVPLGQALGMGVMVWSPLASGLLSGKYKPSEDGGNQGRLDAMRNTDNPAFAKFTERNWQIVSELEAVAGEVGRSMAQVAVNWAATQPGIGSVILGATKLHQLEDNLGALDFALAPEQRARLDAASAPNKRFPYTFFGPEIQAGLTGGVTVGAEPEGYRRPVVVRGRAFGVGADEEDA